jgi:peroxiredoxin
MGNPLVEALEQTFQDVRHLDVPLGERLALIAERVRSLSPVFADAVDRFVGRLALSGAGNAAPQVGDAMPRFMLPDDEGRLVSLEKLLKTAPVVISFLRGHWCPFCRLNAGGLAQVQDDLKPAHIVAITAETQKFAREIKAEACARFPFLTDVGNGYALSLGLAIWVDDEMSSLIASTGWDIPSFQGAEGWILPIPSVFVVGQDGLITARHVEPDYRKRMDIDDLLAAVGRTCSVA